MGKKNFGWILSTFGFLGNLSTILLLFLDIDFYKLDTILGMLSVSTLMFTSGLYLLKKYYLNTTEIISKRKILLIAIIGLVGLIVAVAISFLMQLIITPGDLSGGGFYVLTLLVVYIIVLIFLPSPEKVFAFFKNKGIDIKTENNTLNQSVDRIKVNDLEKDNIDEVIQVEDTSFNMSKTNKILDFFIKFDDVNYKSRTPINKSLSQPINKLIENPTEKSIERTTEIPGEPLEKQSINLTNNTEMKTNESNNKSEFSKNKNEESHTLKSFLNKNKFTGRFFELNKGVQRLLITLGVISSIFFGIKSGRDTYDFDIVEAINITFLTFILYLIAVRVILWIYDGFSNENK